MPSANYTTKGEKTQLVYKGFRGDYDSIKYVKHTTGKLSLLVSHNINEGWFASIQTYGEDEVPDWGFCSGWCKSVKECYQRLRKHPSYNSYPALDLIKGVTEK